jgi:broad specificity phosphatase PhoE
LPISASENKAFPQTVSRETPKETRFIMLRVRFIRHGESLANAGGVTSEQHSIPLTELGREQAALVARSFTTPPDLIVTSPFLRARDTAQPTVARFPQVPVETWPIQEFACLAPARCVETTTFQRRPWVEEFWGMADPHRRDGEGAECFAELIGRARDALTALEKGASGFIAIFAHGQFLNAVRWLILRGPQPMTPEAMQAFRRFHIAEPIVNGEGFVAIWDGERWLQES